MKTWNPEDMTLAAKREFTRWRETAGDEGYRVIVDTWGSTKPGDFDIGTYWKDQVNRAVNSVGPVINMGEKKPLIDPNWLVLGAVAVAGVIAAKAIQD
jgi:hypothetical protein